MTFPFIAFEEVDGSGKTSLARALAERMEGRYYYNPPALLRPFRKYADMAFPTVRFRYHSLGNFVASWHIGRLIRKRPVLCDWWAFSTVAYHSALLGMTLPFPSRLRMPDRIVHVRADWDEIRRRIDGRGKASKYEDLEFLKRASREYDRIFVGRGDVLEIDTTGKTVAESVDELVSRLGW